jgi:hypothetical protein
MYSGACEGRATNAVVPSAKLIVVIEDRSIVPRTGAPTRVAKRSAIPSRSSNSAIALEPTSLATPRYGDASAAVARGVTSGALCVR